MVPERPHIGFDYMKEKQHGDAGQKQTLKSFLVDISFEKDDFIHFWALANIDRLTTIEILL